MPGLFTLRLVKGGPACPARIERREDGLWRAIINGAAGPWHPDPVLAPGVERIWHGGERASEANYDYLTALRLWAKEHAPDHPLLHPHRAVNLASLPPLIP